MTELLGSIDALSSTPARIEKNVNDGLFDEDDIDEGLVDVVDMRNVSSSGLRRYGSRCGNRSGNCYTVTPSTCEISGISTC